MPAQYRHREPPRDMRKSPQTKLRYFSWSGNGSSWPIALRKQTVKGILSLANPCCNCRTESRIDVIPGPGRGNAAAQFHQGHCRIGRCLAHRCARAGAAMSGPLSGMRVLEVAGIGPGPFCGMMLADLGADILRVDRL